MSAARSHRMKDADVLKAGEDDRTSADSRNTASEIALLEGRAETRKVEEWLNK